MPATLILSCAFIAYRVGAERKRTREREREGTKGNEKEDGREAVGEASSSLLLRALFRRVFALSLIRPVRSNYSPAKQSQPLPFRFRSPSLPLPRLSSLPPPFTSPFPPSSRPRFFLPFRPALFRRLMIIVNPLLSSSNLSASGNISFAILYDNHFRRESSSIRRIDVGRGEVAAESAGGCR